MSMMLIKRIPLVTLAAVACFPEMGTVVRASAKDIETAWLAFAQTRGEASLILGDREHATANDIFRAIPDVSLNTIDEEKLQLGFDLFNDPKLSRDGSIACSSCHVAMLGGVDRRPVPTGIGGAQGEFNAPTIFNAALNFRQFWDGRALTLQEQALGPIENPAEFGHDLAGVQQVLESIPDYVQIFRRLYPDGVSVANLADAIAYYETMNFTGLDSPFLRQFDDESAQLDPRALRGQQRFVEVGCASCHNGINLGGNSYQKLGVAESWFDKSLPANESDNGLFRRTGRSKDLHVFKVPTLHNVATTGPWLHDGSITSLQQAVDQMARKQLGRYLSNQDIDDIVAFLRSLGDARSLIGECTANGSYAVTMDCSVKRVASSAAEETPQSDSQLAVAAEISSRHEQAYNDAMSSVADAPSRIESEMQRIRAGEVAHFDFLQFEHIEMLRHARALSFPPADFDAEQKAAALLQAEQWQQQALEYEWFIADFLQSHAVANSALANFQDLINSLAADQDEQALALLGNARISAQSYYAEPSADTLQALETATRALQQASLEARLLGELQIQVGLLKKSLLALQG